ncbi:phage holin family protein [Parageobacillus thermoglucosidasius]|uniref:Holin n=2 Tax=Anoxybacillaceae TaxID=3120669 RepID=A0AAN1D8A0_PARTM|nr:phage holin family protein [Parageobacillus thermoglucosidasius]ALF11881.1 holin [Parageobacillus thermoglucosidasius]ANZ31965.1 holin [Parageobacillus thermoglucosidasius]APM82699.1 holin [Parageobacillus thermoglucosidasius]KJX69745.1 holin [Parageobacillus thermoglucosidasius]MBY6268518.1 holin [Parageobacillus thermoglucosidasius]
MQKYMSMFGASFVGSFISFLIGGADLLIIILLCFVMTDYVTGLIASAIEGKLSSQVGFRGIVRKILVFVLVAVSHLLDIAIGWDNHFIRDAVIFSYIINEFISIVENIGRAGVPLPSFLKKAIQLFKDETG